MSRWTIQNRQFLLAITPPLLPLSFCISSFNRLIVICAPLQLSLACSFALLQTF